MSRRLPSRYSRHSSRNWPRLAREDGLLRLKTVAGLANAFRADKRACRRSTARIAVPAPEAPAPASIESLEARALMAAVTSFTLVDAVTDRDVLVVADGATINLAALPSRQLNIRANPSGRVKSVLFGLDENPAYHTDSSRRFALAGNRRKNYFAWTPDVGDHVLTATPYSRKRARGVAGAGLTIHFAVVDEAWPAAPSAVTASVVADAGVVVRWTDNAGNEDGFRVERAAVGGEFVHIGTIAPDVTSYADPTLAPGQYRYRVSAFNEAGPSTASVSAPVTVSTPPAAPDELTAATLGGRRISLSWRDNSDDEQGFRVERSADGGVTFAWLAELTAGATGYIDSGLAAGTTYHYRVAAYRGDAVSLYSNSPDATIPRPADVVYSGPIVITRGGTYTGNWESLDPAVPAVRIETAEPVIIQDAIVRGRGDLIVSLAEHARVTVKSTTGYGLNPDVYGLSPGRFFEAVNFDGVVLEDNYLEGTGGIKLLDYLGNHTPADSVRVVGNSALNIDGRRSDGAGGFLDFNERTRRGDGLEEEGYKIRQFLQLDKVQGVPGIEIAWNRVVNEPGRSRVEDNINVYKSSGAPGSPIRIHDNYIQGAYTVRPWQGGTTTDGTWDYDWGYAGGGILLGDGSSGVAYVEAFGNHVVSTSNYGIAIAAGHDVSFHHNRVVSSGRLPDGRWIAEQNVGVYIWDLYDTGPGNFYNNTAYDNLIGWVNEPDGSRNDWWVPDATSFDNAHWIGDVTPEVEAEEFARWDGKRAAATLV